MGAVAGSFVVAALLLGLGGILEARRPAATVGALRTMGLPASPLAVRTGGLVAVVIGAGAVVTVSRPFALAVAGFYLLLAGFVLAALVRRVPLKSCGCFGRDDTPPSVGHLALDVTAAVVAAGVGVGPGARGWASVHLDGGPVAVGLFVILAGTATAFVYLALTVLPRSAAGGSRAEPSST